MTPEARAREKIDRKLMQAGWLVQDLKQLNVGAAASVSVREFPAEDASLNEVQQAHSQANPEWNVNQAIAIFRVVDGELSGFISLTLEVCRSLPIPLPPQAEPATVLTACRRTERAARKAGANPGKKSKRKKAAA